MRILHIFEPLEKYSITKQDVDFLERTVRDFLLKSYQTKNSSVKKRYLILVDEIMYGRGKRDSLKNYAVIEEKGKISVVQLTERYDFLQNIFKEIIKENNKFKSIINIIDDLITKPNLVNLDLSKVANVLTKGKKYKLVKGDNITKKIKKLNGLMTVMLCNSSVTLRELENIVDKIENDLSLFNDLIWGAKIVEGQKKTEVYTLVVM